MVPAMILTVRKMTGPVWCTTNGGRFLFIVFIAFAFTISVDALPFVTIVRIVIVRMG